MDVLIGIPTAAAAQQPREVAAAALARTLAALASLAAVEVLLLPLEGHPAPETLPLGVSTAEGSFASSAACFNRLTKQRDADVYLLLEAGSVPAPGWLDRLLATFARLPRCGLTGPSTNRGWNEQCVLPQAALEADAAASQARAIERRYGASRRSLRPLHSLLDFCYAVRREVVEAIGPADEAYAPGSCWEMDYNIRAHRAGFLGVWTCGAYVQRAPAPDVELAAEFLANKHRYQDKFCGRRLRGERGAYREHCRGDACPNFAPPALLGIQPAAPLPIAAEPPREMESAALPERPASIKKARETPLVSCIMPTYNRRAFLTEAFACFAAQTYPRLELIVVDDGPDAIADLVPQDPRIRYFRLEGRLNTGAKRNFACMQAAGEYIAHWDDDDWYPSDRILRQVEAMQAAGAAASGSTTMYYLNRERREAFRYSYRGAGCDWLGALMYTRAAWQQSPFDAIAIGEDVRFLGRIPASSRLDLRDPVLNIGRIHAGNTSPKVTNGVYWKSEPYDDIAALAVTPVPAQQAVADVPLISCIMPTANRRPFLELTFANFFAQSWPNKELIVIDDGTDPVGDLCADRPGVRYVRPRHRLTIGAKRNLACELAKGEIIAHWDDDDWYGSERLERQAMPILEDRADLTGLVSTHTLEMPGARFWMMSEDLHKRMFIGDIHGGTLVFRRSLLDEGIRYPEANLAEDAAIVRQLLQRRRRVMRIDEPGLFVYLRHGRNTWKFQPGRFVDPRGWKPVNAPENFLPSTVESYREACRLACGGRV